MTKKETITVLVNKGYVTENQEKEYLEYQQRNIFSLRVELLFLMYLSVILFTSGVGILIYKNIDSIGHSAILGLLFLVTISCFYFSFKKSKGFYKTKTSFDNPIYDYLVVAGSLLANIFLGYLQYQYSVFGNSFQWVSLVSAVFCFGVAYFFDQKTVLSLAITSLTAFVGITLTPKTLIENALYHNAQLSYYGLLLAVILLFWAYYSGQQQLKKHFNFVFYTFAQHLGNSCIIAGLIDSYWGIFILFSIGMSYYFYRLSYANKETSLFVFTLIYGYISWNIILGRLLSTLQLDTLFTFFSILLPFYVVGSIVLFIKVVRNFNQKKHASL